MAAIGFIGGAGTTDQGSWSNRGCLEAFDESVIAYYTYQGDPDQVRVNKKTISCPTFNGARVTVTGTRMDYVGDF